jgi:hypothetical protein
MEEKWSIKKVLESRCAGESGEPIQFEIAEFESNSESRTISY